MCFQNNRYQIVTDRSSEGIYFMSSETHKQSISILIFGGRIGFDIIL